MENAEANHSVPAPSHDSRKALKIKERNDALKDVERRLHMKRVAAKSVAGQDTVRQFPNISVVPDVIAPLSSPPVPQAALQLRHRIIFLSFLVFVLGTCLSAAWYLWERASDRYVSSAGFSIRAEDTSSAIELLGGVAELSGSSSDNEEILYKFIQSQELVRKVDARLNLRQIWSKPNAAHDPIFSYHAPGSIEDLKKYWSRMVHVYSDSSTGLIELEVQAFAAPDALKIARAILEESSIIINRLSNISREDTMRYAKEELQNAVKRLKTARSNLTKFRSLHQIVTPDATLQIQSGLLSSLEMQLAETMIELDILYQTTTKKDPRTKQALRKQGVIADRIRQERNKLGLGNNVAEIDVGFAGLVSEFESLSVDLQFAEHAYTAALANYDSAISESRRQKMYLAAHINPSMAETSTYPNRPFILGLVAVFSFLIWSTTVVIFYSLRDRR